MVMLAIADPPYLGRAVRWYGGGCGVGYGVGAADFHPDAAKWDDPESHRQLVRDLVSQFDGWAIALNAGALPTYLAECPSDVHVMVWHKRNSFPSGSRIRNSWEPVIVRVPPARRGRVHGLPALSDVLDTASPRIGFAGAKPAKWTRWVLAAMGFDPATDRVADLFPGSGSVGRAIDGMLL